MSASVAPPKRSGVELSQLGNVCEVAEGGSGRTVADFRFPTYSLAELETSERFLLEKGREKLGPIVAALRTKCVEGWMTVLAELNEVAGGQASARATTLAHHALKAHTLLELSTLHAEFAVAEAREQVDSKLRNAAGIAIVASDLLNKAYAAATEEGKAKAAKLEPVDALMATLGVSEGPGSAPVSTGGVGSIGAPLPSKPATSPKSSRKKDQP